MIDLDKTKSQIDQTINLPEFAKSHGVKQSRGGGNYHSIYSKDSNPSLSFFRSKGRWRYKCHSTGKEGDYIIFCQDLLNLSFIEAVKYLAGYYHIEQDQTFKKKQAITRAPEPERKPIREPEPIETSSYFFNERAGIYEFEQGLNRMEAERCALRDLKHSVFTSLLDYCASLNYSDAVLRYMESRDLDAKTLKDFRIVEMREPEGLKAELLTLYEPEDLRLTGLTNEKGNLVLFYHRIIIPYLTGNYVTHLKGRTLPEFGADMQSTPKYINIKGNIPEMLYNENIIETARATGRIYLTEGEFDAVILQKYGLNAVSLLSASNIPPSIGTKLKGLRVIVLTDNDKAGKAAGQKILSTLKENFIQAEYRELPPGVKDVTEFILKLKQGK